MDFTAFIVRNMKDYLDWILQSRWSDIAQNDQTVSFKHAHMYYRGQSCINWPVIAGVFRAPFMDSPYVENELLRKSTLRLWKELQLYSSYLDKLVFLQHYGMKTRLIDVTFNPLIALYFACLADPNNKECDGVVYCGYKGSDNGDKIAELTAEYIFTHSLYDIDDEIKALSKTHSVHLSEFSKPVLLLPPFNNDRIASQKGAFIMSPLINLIDKIHVSAFCGSLNKEFSKKIALIPSSCKYELLKELHALGIDKGTVFQSITEKIESIIQEKQWAIERINQIKLE